MKTGNSFFLGLFLFVILIFTYFLHRRRRDTCFLPKTGFFFIFWRVPEIGPARHNAGREKKTRNIHRHFYVGGPISNDLGLSSSVKAQISKADAPHRFLACFPYHSGVNVADAKYTKLPKCNGRCVNGCFNQQSPR